MMRCNKCGAENEDDARFCLACGHKLRSRLSQGPDGPASPDEGGGAETIDASAPGACRGCGKYLEAIVYALILTAGLILSLINRNLTVLYVLTGVVALVAWLRRI